MDQKSTFSIQKNRHCFVKNNMLNKLKNQTNITVFMCKLYFVKVVSYCFLTNITKEIAI